MINETPLKLFLHYPDASKASKRVVEGRGDLAKRVAKAAENQHLPLGEDQDLVQLFARVDFGESLSLEVLDVIAETINWLRAGGESAVREPQAPVSELEEELGGEPSDG